MIARRNIKPTNIRSKLENAYNGAPVQRRDNRGNQQDDFGSGRDGSSQNLQLGSSYQSLQNLRSGRDSDLNSRTSSQKIQTQPSSQRVEYEILGKKFTKKDLGKIETVDGVPVINNNEGGSADFDFDDKNRPGTSELEESEFDSS